MPAILKGREHRLRIGSSLFLKKIAGLRLKLKGLFL